MNKKDIAQIRKRLAPNKNNATSICGCYVNKDGEIISKFRLPFIHMEREDADNFLNLFKKVLSGTDGQNLLPIDLSAEQVMNAPEHKILTGLKDTALKDDGLRDYFYDKIRSVYRSEETYVILLLHDVWDVPKKLKDGSNDEDAETNMFGYILCAVCPVKLQSGGLAYRAEENVFGTKGADLMVCAPENGFMFPAYEDGGANIYGALYYSRKTDDIAEDLMTELFGETLPVPADTQQHAICSMLQESLGRECSLDVVQSVRDHVREKIEEKKLEKDPETPKITVSDLSDAMESSGVSPERVQEFRHQFEDTLGLYSEIPAVNVVAPKKLEMRTPDVVIKVAPDRGDLVQTRVIDGQKYILIRAEDGVELNGVNIHIE